MLLTVGPGVADGIALVVLLVGGQGGGGHRYQCRCIAPADGNIRLHAPLAESRDSVTKVTQPDHTPILTCDRP
jgi:hypothetical protein